MEQDTESAKGGEQRRKEGGKFGEVEVATGEVLRVGAAGTEHLPKAALRRDAVTPSCSVRGQPEGKPVRLSAVAAGESVAIWKRFGNSAGGKVSLPI